MNILNILLLYIIYNKLFYKLAGKIHHWGWGKSFIFIMIWTNITVKVLTLKQASINICVTLVT